MKKVFTLPKLVSLFFLWTMLFMQDLIAQGGLEADLGTDTLFVCADEIHDINPNAVGGTPPYVYLWNDSSTQDELTILPQVNDRSWVWVEVRDGQNQVARDSIYIIALGNCVWPGDMNGDGVANHLDLLEWGRAFGAIGPVRPDAHTNWIGQASPNWGGTLPGGHDFAYADADGDGFVHLNDLQAIEQNYISIRPQSGAPSINGPELWFSFPSEPVLTVGDTIRIPVFLGTANQPVDSIFGIALSIEYDNSIINAGSVEIAYDSSWLGTPQLDLVGMDRDFHQAGQLDVAITRITQEARTGQGKLFDLIVTIDNVAGKNNNAFTLNINALGAQLITKNEQIIPLTSRSLSLDILPEPSPRGQVASRMNVEVYPNPTSSLLIIDPGKQGIREVQLIDMPGKQLYGEKKEFDTTLTWNVSGLERGIYFLRMKTTEGIWLTRKIQLID